MELTSPQWALSPLLSSHFSWAPNFPPSSSSGWLEITKPMRMQKDCLAKCFLDLFASTLLLNPESRCRETGMPHLHFGCRARFSLYFPPVDHHHHHHQAPDIRMFYKICSNSCYLAHVAFVAKLVTTLSTTSQSVLSRVWKRRKGGRMRSRLCFVSSTLHCFAGLGVAAMREGAAWEPLQECFKHLWIVFSTLSSPGGKLPTFLAANFSGAPLCPKFIHMQKMGA